MNIEKLVKETAAKNKLSPKETEDVRWALQQVELLRAGQLTPEQAKKIRALFSDFGEN
jgi:hypothetical protein